MIVGVGSILITFGLLIYDIKRKKNQGQTKVKKP